MDERNAQFFVAVADACGAANLASLEVEMVTVTGHRVLGVPSSAPVARRPGDELDETGYGRALLVDDEVIDLAEVRRCTLIAPDGM